MDRVTAALGKALMEAVPQRLVSESDRTQGASVMASTKPRQEDWQARLQALFGEISTIVLDHVTSLEAYHEFEEAIQEAIVHGRDPMATSASPRSTGARRSRAEDGSCCPSASIWITAS